MHDMNAGQKIAYAFAILFFVLGAASLVGAGLYNPRSDLDPIRASLLGASIFFAGAGTVLYVIAKSRLKGLLSDDDPTPEQNRRDS